MQQQLFQGLPNYSTIIAAAKHPPAVAPMMISNVNTTVVNASQLEQETEVNTNSSHLEFNNDDSCSIDNVKNEYLVGSYNMLSKINKQQNQSSIVKVATSEEMNKELLIEHVRKYPCIWDMKSNDYKDNSKKRIAWQIIYDAFKKQHKGFLFVIFLSFFYYYYYYFFLFFVFIFTKKSRN